MKNFGGENMVKKIITLLTIIQMLVFLLGNISYGIFTPNIYESEDKTILAYGEINAISITLPSGQRVHATNIKGKTKMEITTITEPVELILVIDVSGSMHRDRIASAKNSAKTLVNNLFEVAKDIKVTVISFASTESMKVQIDSSTDKNAIISRIDGLSTGGGTDMQPALKKAQEIFNRTQTEGIYKFIVNLTDGSTDNSTTCYHQLKKMEEQGIGIFNILVGGRYTAAFSMNGVDVGVIYEDIREEELEEIYEEIYVGICEDIIFNSSGLFKDSGKNYFATDQGMYLFLDQELLQGSLLEIEYVINIKVAFNVFKLELQDEVDKQLTFNPSTSLLTEEGTNEDKGWVMNEEISYKNGHNLVVSLCKEAEQKKQEEIEQIEQMAQGGLDQDEMTNENGYLGRDKNNYIIKKGRTYQTKLVLSCLLTTKDETSFNNNLIFRLNGQEELTQSLQALETNIVPPFGENRGRFMIVVTIAGLTLMASILAIKLVARKKD